MVAVDRSVLSERGHVPESGLGLILVGLDLVSERA
jgi:hypothetical protein